MLKSLLNKHKAEIEQDADVMDSDCCKDGKEETDEAKTGETE